MSQRNPMNDRYQTDERKGQTRKSAASAKPKSKAAASVRVETKTKIKTPQQKKAVQRQEREQRQEIDRKYYHPPTAEYKKWRRIWWGLLIVAIVTTAFSFFVRMGMPDQEVIGLVVLAIGYMGFIGALALDFIKIKKIRRQYQEEMTSKASKEVRAEAKKEHAAQIAARKAAAEAAAKADAETSLIRAAKKSFFSFFGLRASAERASKVNKEIAKACKEVAKASVSNASSDNEKS